MGNCRNGLWKSTLQPNLSHPMDLESLQDAVTALNQGPVFDAGFSIVRKCENLSQDHFLNHFLKCHASIFEIIKHFMIKNVLNTYVESDKRLYALYELFLLTFQSACFLPILQLICSSNYLCFLHPKKRNAYIMGHQVSINQKQEYYLATWESLCNHNNMQRKSYCEGGGISFFPHAGILDFLNSTPLSDRSNHVTIGSLKQLKPQPLKTQNF